MRGKISKKIRKFAFAATIKDGWNAAKMADQPERTNVRRIDEHRVLCTWQRKHDAPRRYYRRMKKLWSSLSVDQKLEVRSTVFMPGGMQRGV
jgi:hypothetical protein